MKLDVDFELSLSKLFDVLTIGLSNLCETASIITSSSYSGVKSIGLLVLGYSFVNMEEKAKLNVEYIEIYPTLLQNSENLLNPDWIYNSGRKCSK